MSTQIEMTDQERARYRGGHIVWLIVFFIAWVVRSVLKIAELEMDTTYTVLMAVLILSVLVQAYYAVRIKLVERRINRDASLKHALNNELVRLHQLKAWRASFFSVILFIVIAAVVSLFVDFNDLMLIFITALLIGFGTYNTTVYLLDR
jgi:hypothetical protein